MKCPYCDSERLWVPAGTTGHCKDCHQPIEFKAYDQDDMNEITADRDKWKARAKFFNGDCSIESCYICKYYGNGCNNGNAFEIDWDEVDKRIQWRKDD